MLLTKKLLGFLNSVFDKNAHPFLATKVIVPLGVTLTVADQTLSGASSSGQLFSVDLTEYTISGIIEYLQTVKGINVSYSCGVQYQTLSACVLIDGSYPVASDGTCQLLGYTSLLWSILDALSVELTAAYQQVLSTIQQMTISQANDEWASVWGGYFGVIRRDGETLAAYAQRIVDDTVRPRGNNKAIELAMLAKFGQPSSVTDVDSYTGSIEYYNGKYQYNSNINYSSPTTPVFGLFTVSIGYDLLSGSAPDAYVSDIYDFVDRIRHAGTQIQAVVLTASAILDSVNASSDAFGILSLKISNVDDVTSASDGGNSAVHFSAAYADTANEPTDIANLTFLTSTKFNGKRLYNGAIPYASGVPGTIALS